MASSESYDFSGLILGFFWNERLDWMASEFHENTGHPCVHDSKAVLFILVNEL